MKRKELPNGLIRLTASEGIRDKRNGMVFSEVVCKAKDEANYTAN